MKHSLKINTISVLLLSVNLTYANLVNWPISYWRTKKDLQKGNIYLLNATGVARYYQYHSQRNGYGWTSGYTIMLPSHSICELDTDTQPGYYAKKAVYRAPYTGGVGWDNWDQIVEVASSNDFTSLSFNGFYITGNDNLDLCSNENEEKCMLNNNNTSWELGFIPRNNLSSGDNNYIANDMYYVYGVDSRGPLYYTNSWKHDDIDIVLGEVDSQNYAQYMPLSIYQYPTNIELCSNYIVY